jgi:hypothetical protein
MLVGNWQGQTNLAATRMKFRCTSRRLVLVIKKASHEVRRICRSNLLGVLFQEKSPQVEREISLTQIRVNKFQFESALGQEGNLLILKRLNSLRLKVIERSNSFMGTLAMKATFYSQNRAKSHQGSSFQRCPKTLTSFWQLEAQIRYPKQLKKSTCSNQPKNETMKTRVNSTNL